MRFNQVIIISLCAMLSSPVLMAGNTELRKNTNLESDIWTLKLSKKNIEAKKELFFWQLRAKPGQLIRFKCIDDTMEPNACHAERVYKVVKNNGVHNAKLDIQYELVDIKVVKKVEGPGGIERSHCQSGECLHEK